MTSGLSLRILYYSPAFKAAMEALEARYKTVEEDLREVQDTCADTKAAAIVQVQEGMDLQDQLTHIYDAVFTERAGTQDILTDIHESAQSGQTTDEDYNDKLGILESDMENMDTELQERRDEILALSQVVLCTAEWAPCSTHSAVSHH